MTDFFSIAKHNAPLPRKEQTTLAIAAFAGDKAASDTLVLCNMRLAISVARRHERAGLELEDLIATACAGILDAIRKFDPSSGANFPYVARQWMVARCQEVVKARGVVSGDDDTTRNLYRKVTRARNVLQAQGVDAGPEAIASYLNLDKKKIAAAWSVVFCRATSMSTPAKGDEKGATFGDTLTSTFLRQDELLDRTRKSEKVAVLLSSFIDTLSLRDRHIFSAHNLAEYLGNERASGEELAIANGISKPRVSQISKALNRKCAEFFKNNDLVS
jgi:RNA polymerase sigma factor (sigma-70 family)